MWTTAGLTAGETADEENIRVTRKELGDNLLIILVF